MTRVRICIELDEELYKSYQLEAARRGVSVESLVEQVVHTLLDELRREQDEGTDHPIIPA